MNNHELIVYTDEGYDAELIIIEGSRGQVFKLLLKCFQYLLMS